MHARSGRGAPAAMALGRQAAAAVVVGHGGAAPTAVAVAVEQHEGEHGANSGSVDHHDQCGEVAHGEDDWGVGSSA